MTGRSSLKIRFIPSLRTEAPAPSRGGRDRRAAAVEAADREGHTDGGCDRDRRRPDDHEDGEIRKAAGRWNPRRGGRQRGRGASRMLRHWKSCRRGSDLRPAPRARRAGRRRARPRNLRHSAGRPKRRSLWERLPREAARARARLLASPAERDQLVVRADPIPEPNDVLGHVLTALFGLRDFPLHPAADPLQVFLLLAGPGCPD